MAFVLLMIPEWTEESKDRIEKRVLYALQAEGVAADEVTMRFETQQEYRKAADEPVEPFSLFVTDKSLKSRSRRTKSQLGDLKESLRELLRRDKVLNSFQLQDKLGLKECDWAPTTLRRLLKELVESEEVSMSGQKRGTQYHWLKDEAEPQAKLVKKA